MKTNKTAIVRLRYNPTGAEVDYTDKYYSRWDWGSGNYSCDCNRGIFFQDSGGKLPDEAPGYGIEESMEQSLCGDSEFTVLRITLDGMVTEGDPRDD